jgi:predicted transcriptional regulator
MDKAKLLSLTAEIVSAHASTNELTQEALITEIGHVFAKLASLAGTEGTVEIAIEAGAASAQEIKPAVPLAAAFGADKVFCMVCGAGMKTLKRHLSAAHGMKPGQYRKQFGIPAGTLLVASKYSEARKEMAKGLNLAERLQKARAARAKKAGKPVKEAAPAKVAKVAKVAKAVKPVKPARKARAPKQTANA